jgi:protein arginine kinase
MADHPNNQFLELPAFAHPWEKNTNSIWLASTLSLHRNIDKFNFPQKLDGEKRHLVSKLILDAFKTIPALSNTSVFLSGSLHPVDREFLSEHFLVFEPARADQHGHDLVTEETGTLLIQINANNHLELTIIDPSGELEKTFGRLVSIEQEIEKHLPFSFSDSFGYLTSDPCQCGTGLTINAYVHIPALISRGGHLHAIDGEKKEGLLFTSLQGNPEDLIGDLLVIRNRWTLGVTEETVISSIHNAVLKILAEEHALREALKEKKETAIVDKVSRAIGTLQHSFTIDTSESLRALSQLKFGVELGWVNGMSLETVNELFFNCRRAHLAKKINPSSYTTPQLYADRAQYFRKLMKDVALSTSSSS